MADVRTWIEIDNRRLHHNVEQFFRLISKRTRFMAVIKSNAYGHGLMQVAKLLSSYKLPATSYEPLWFGVDSIVEALTLRKEGIELPILVLGYTLPSRLADATEHRISLSVSTFETLNAITKLKKRPEIHLKIDTGMHRQGFQAQDIPAVADKLKASGLKPEGIFTHFAAAKDIAYPTYTKYQLSQFGDVLNILHKSGIRPAIRHAAATGGTLLFPEAHFDMVRVGMGLYGYWPSPEIQRAAEAHLLPMKQEINLKPVLSWKTLISEVKDIPAGSFIGYDLTERVRRKTRIGILPIGYWHGLDRGLSSMGEVLIRGRRARLLGRISMDMAAVDLSGILGAKPGTEATVIGQDGKDAIWADDPAMKIDTSPYEFLTRINPLIRRTTV